MKDKKGHSVFVNGRSFVSFFLFIKSSVWTVEFISSPTGSINFITYRTLLPKNTRPIMKSGRVLELIKSLILFYIRP